MNRIRTIYRNLSNYLDKYLQLNLNDKTEQKRVIIIYIRKFFIPCLSFQYKPFSLAQFILHERREDRERVYIVLHFFSMKQKNK